MYLPFVDLTAAKKVILFAFFASLVSFIFSFSLFAFIYLEFSVSGFYFLSFSFFLCSLSVSIYSLRMYFLNYRRLKMSVQLKPSRYAVFVDNKRVGTIIPRNDLEWVFLYTEISGPNGTFNSYIAESPESAIMLCPYIKKSSAISRSL